MLKVAGRNSSGTFKKPYLLLDFPDVLTLQLGFCCKLEITVILVHPYYVWPVILGHLSSFPVLWTRSGEKGKQPQELETVAWRISVLASATLFNLDEIAIEMTSRYDTSVCKFDCTALQTRHKTLELGRSVDGHQLS